LKALPPVLVLLLVTSGLLGNTAGGAPASARDNELKNLRKQITDLENQVRTKRDKLERLLFPMDERLPGAYRDMLQALKVMHHDEVETYFSLLGEIAFSSDPVYRKFLKIAVIYYRGRILADRYASNYLFEIQAYEHPEDTEQQRLNKQIVKERHRRLNHEADERFPVLVRLARIYLDNVSSMHGLRVLPSLPSPERCKLKKEFELTLLDFNPSYMEKKLDSIACESLLTSMGSDLRASDIDLLFDLGDMLANKYVTEPSQKTYRQLARVCFERVIELTKLKQYHRLLLLSRQRLTSLR